MLIYLTFINVYPSLLVRSCKACRRHRRGHHADTLLNEGNSDHADLHTRRDSARGLPDALQHPNRAPTGAQDDTPLGASAELQGLLVLAHLCAAWLAAPQTDPLGASQAESWASSAPTCTLKDCGDRMQMVAAVMKVSTGDLISSDEAAVASCIQQGHAKREGDESLNLLEESCAETLLCQCAACISTVHWKRRYEWQGECSQVQPQVAVRMLPSQQSQHALG